VIVRINDRGPYAGDRILDLSAGAAEQIGLADSGVAQVKAEILESVAGNLAGR
jgi:rare lipoprotein A